MIRTHACSLTALPVLALALSINAASAHTTCAPFQAVSELDTIHFIDHGEDELSPGDQRVLKFMYFDTDGNRIGTQHTTTTVMHPHPEDGDGHALMANAVLVFDAGTLRTSLFSQLRDPTDTSQSSVDPVEWVVLGGTGVFAGATGNTRPVPRGDGTYDVEIDIVCPG
ncbi:allene oxide cyclase barrel-like domain-containing protein [Bauldia sp.]|uniref:allene oxide cyclase barrel-like domain-containing protein n=1 Tax=Bauldia sp. TaxID=2575872 RepID=UPI003BAB6F14